MIDKSFYNKHQDDISLFQLSEVLKDHLIEVVGNGDDIKLSNITTLDNASKGDVSFLHNAKYLKALSSSKAGVILIDQALYKEVKSVSQIFMICRDVYGACSRITNYFYGYKNQDLLFDQARNIHPEAIIDDTAIIAPNCFVGKASIGANVIIHPNTVIADGVVIGDNVIIGSNCSISYAHIGEPPKKKRLLILTS